MLTKSEEKFLRRYEKPLQEPKWKFALIYGWSYALITMVLVTIFELLMDSGTTVFALRTVLMRIGIWVVAGLVYGFWLRSILMKRYRQIQKRAEGSLPQGN